MEGGRIGGFCQPAVWNQDFINCKGAFTIYIGHLAVGLAAKTQTEKVPLWATIGLAYTNDILKLGFRAVGLEQPGTYILDIKSGIFMIIPGNIPWSHGLFMSVVWSLLAAGIAYLIYRDRRTATIVGIVVISHWLLDFIVHPPELPLLFNGSPTVGLGLWMTKPGLIIATVLEISMVIVGLALYLGSLKKQLLQLISLVNSLD